MRGKGSVLAVCVLLSALTGCARQDIDSVLQEETGSSAKGESVPESIADGSGNPEDGIVRYSVTFQNAGVSTNTTRAFFSDWKGSGMEIICTDPSCRHLPYNSRSNPDPVCTAALLDDANAMTSLTFLWKGGRFICISGYEPVDDAEKTYYTEVYRCDADGGNREKAAQLPHTMDWNAALIEEGKIYYTGVMRSVESQVEDTSEGGGIPSIMIETSYDVGLFVMDLTSDHLEPECIWKTEGIDSERSFFNYCADEENVYCEWIPGDGGSTVYAIGKAEGKCRELLTCTSGNLAGTIDGTVYFTELDDESGEELNASILKAFDTVTGEMKTVIREPFAEACVMGNRLAVGERRRTGEEGEETYSMLYRFCDKEGNPLQEISYDRNVSIIGQFGENVLFYDASAYYFLPVEKLERYEEAERICDFFGVENG